MFAQVDDEIVEHLDLQRQLLMCVWGLLQMLQHFLQLLLSPRRCLFQLFGELQSNILEACRGSVVT